MVSYALLIICTPGTAVILDEHFLTTFIAAVTFGYYAEQHWYYVLFFSCTLIDALIKCHLSKKNSLTKFVKIAGSAPFNKGRTKADFHEDGISLLFFSDEVKKDCQRLPQSITIYQIGNRRLSMI